MSELEGTKKNAVMITYPYHDGVMKEFALIVTTQRGDLSVKNLNLLDPIGLETHIHYHNTLEDLKADLASVFSSGERVLNYKAFRTGLSLNILNWRWVSTI